MDIEGRRNGAAEAADGMDEAQRVRERCMVALLERVAAGSSGAASPRADAEAALRELYEMTAPRLNAVAMRVLSNRDWAEDVLQEAYLQIWRGAGTFRESLSPPLAWMGVIVRSRALDFLRRRTAQRVDVHAELEGAVADTVATDTPGPMDAHDASQQAKALHDCLDRLEAKQREVVVLAYMRDLSHSELAESLKLPLGTVKTWVRRGLERLRGCMAGLA